MNIQSLVEGVKSRFAPPVPSDSILSISALEDRITDEWFRSHFVHAADTVGAWLSQAVDVRASRILDFGCGDGIMALGVALKQRPRKIIGVDIHDSNKYLRETARAQIGIDRMPKNLRFVTVRPGQRLRWSVGAVNAVFSWSVFEHIDKALLPRILSGIYKLLPSGGTFFLQIEPLYYSPFGSHLSGLLTEPWAHLLLSPEELMEEIDRKQPEHMADDQKNRTFDVCSFDDFKTFLKREYKSLNGLTVSELLAYVANAGFVVEKKHLHMVDITPPAALFAKHSSDDLRCNEIMLLLRRP